MKGYYTNIRQDLLALLPKKMIFEHVLDVGCASGVTGEYLKNNKRAKKITGLEINPTIAQTARQKLDRVCIQSADSPYFPFMESEFDLLIFADILEHMLDPWSTLKNLVYFLKPGGFALISFPNIQNWKIVLKLVLGAWEYSDHGILDRTHLRFFTVKSSKKLLMHAGLSVLKTKRTKGLEMKLLNYLTAGFFNNMLSYHIYFLAQKN